MGRKAYELLQEKVPHIAARMDSELFANVRAVDAMAYTPEDWIEIVTDPIVGMTKATALEIYKALHIVQNRNGRGSPSSGQPPPPQPES